MNILFCQYKNIAELDLEETLNYMGHHIDILDSREYGNDYDVKYMQDLQNRLMEKQYDLVFSVNFAPIVSKVCNIFKIKYISYGVDSPWYQLNSEAVKNPCNYIFLFDKVQYEKYKSANEGQIFYLPLASNSRFFDTISGDDAEAESYKCDVSFVGSLYEDKQKYDFYKGFLPEYIQGFLDAGIKIQKNIYGYNVFKDLLTDEMADKIVECIEYEPAKDYAVDNKDVVHSEIIGKKCSQLERTELVCKLAENFDFKLFTQSDTSEYPQIKNMGPVDSRFGMPRVFKASKININTTIKTIESGIPLRVFDIMAAKGFVLSNYQSELLDYFVPGEDLEIFNDLEDMVAKVDYYLKHEEERKRIAENGYRKVQLIYSVENRIKEMFEKTFRTSAYNYGRNPKAEVNMAYALQAVLDQLKINSIIDVDMLFGKANSFGANVAFNSGYIVDGLCLITPKNQVADSYSQILTAEEIGGRIYDLAVMCNVLKLVQDNEKLSILKEIAAIAPTIIVEYRDDYLNLIENNTKYNASVLDIAGEKFILIITC